MQRRVHVPQRKISRAGFTLPETLVVGGIVAVLLAMLIPFVGRARSAAQAVTCLGNLRHIHTALLQYAVENQRRYPQPVTTRISWEQSLRPYLSDSAAYRCKGDAEVFPAVGSSYDWRDTGRDDTTMAGRSLADANRQDAVLAFEALPGWHKKNLMNAVWVDGSAHEMDQSGCLSDLLKPLRGGGTDLPAIVFRRRGGSS